ncbi:HAMP domain-containing histidine kinase [Herbiconiux sp. CPCC 203407]|uniref:histidine kinase n=1 Tax=Herbiconiux oxytropis TaxID=2970915 RepID=A0AA41XHV8_9MICO|nr:HAMP domain-containing sensor histidine kinase [Herbiconiux oxytropis]MCS5723137.1 HAMP domain-containing histidine kinase [Herbiconiux oxytropis]MCS5725306.1 HAMP domain-containing histidine kinase [Herbiconiux oxytropis]
MGDAGRVVPSRADAAPPSPPPAARRRGPRSLRARITLLATVVVALAVGLGGVGFASVLSSTLADSAASAAEAELTRFEEVLDRAGPGGLSDLDGYAQVVRDGRVVGATEDVEGALPLAESEFDGSRTVGVREGDDSSDDDIGDRVVVVSTEVDDGLLVAGVDADGRFEAVGTTVVLLLVAVPLIVALVAITCWIVVGRALRPVERIRRETEQVSGDDLARRVAEPGTHDEIGRLATTMNSMLDRLEQSQLRQRRFVADASHELRSPLSSLRQNAEVARDYPGCVDPARFATAVADDSERMAELVDALLVLSKADERSLRLKLRPVDLDDLALAEAARLREFRPPSAGAASAEPVALTVDASGIAAARVRGDDRMLARVLRNLGDNAARHAHSRVTISTAVVAGRSTVTVDDDGSGIPETERDRVFERFVRLDEARSRDRGGSGLGLAIVRELVAAHGGTITVGTSPRGGARFVVSLPAEN